MKMNSELIEVYADWKNLQGPVLLCLLRVEELRGEEIFSFKYEDSWLKQQSLVLDPDLLLYQGWHYLQNEKSNFGLFLDSSPDRWGRLLMQRKEAILARQEKRKVKQLGEKDFLLSVYDESRMGALRFKRQNDTQFQNADSHFITPPWTRLRDLEFASYLFEEEGDEENWLSLLLAPGSSLGGARPKANVLDEKGNIWIAKFPAKNDIYDSAAWEMLCAQMAQELDLKMSKVKLEKFSDRGRTFLTKRFDRLGKERIHFASAMTLLGKKDGYSFLEGASYLELVEFILRQSSKPKADLKELWSRIVFSIAVGNTDDHLRNHGFLLKQNGWRLSPCYDINPNPKPQGLSLAIDEFDNSLDYELALSTAEYYQLQLKEAHEIIQSTQKTVSQWNKKARALDIKSFEIDLMAPAFER